MISRENYLKLMINWEHPDLDQNIEQEFYYLDEKDKYISIREDIKKRLVKNPNFSRFHNLIAAEGMYMIKVSKRSNYENVLYCEDGVPHIITLFLKRRSETAFLSDVEDDSKTGGEAMKRLQWKLAENLCLDYREANLARLIKANGKADIYKDVAKCTVSAFDYANDIFKLREIKVYKADVSSAYPAEMLKGLPTFEDCKVLPGRVEPNEDYPFAFYPDTRHIAIYNELDSRKFKNCHGYPYQRIGRRWNPLDFNKDTKTILCKRMDKEIEIALADSMNYFYEHKNDDKDAKLVMNASIGYMHRNNKPDCSCISAVVIARCAHNMIIRFNQLENEGNIPVLVNTDSISWIGGESEVYTTEKKIGAFVLEEINTLMYIKGVKAYQYYKNGSILTTKCAGRSKEENAAMKWKEIANINEEDTFLLVEKNSNGEVR